MLVWVAEINRWFRLGESLRDTVHRPWYDLLAFRLAMKAEQRIVEQSRTTDA